MTKQHKITLSASRDIPFNKLVLSPSNVRRIKAGVSIEELAEDIARRTLLSSITVRPVLDETGAETGMFEIPAGGRRYRALELLVKQKRLARTAPVPCIVRTDGLAEEDSLEALKDYFGGALAYQDVVIALMQGPETDYGRAETLCRHLFGRVRRCHRVTVEQMALLEPAAAEVIAGSVAGVLRAATDEVVRRGVPEEAARAFMLGHIRIILAVLFDQTGFPVSDAAKIAFQIGEEYVIRPDWKRVFEPEIVRRTIERMVHPR